MKIFQTLLGLVIVYCIFQLNSCQHETKISDPIVSTAADSLLQNAINVSRDLSINPTDQKKAVSILKKIIPQSTFASAADNLQSLCYHTLGGIYYNLSEIDSALIYLDTAIAMRKIQDYPSVELELSKSYYVSSLVNHEAFNDKKAISNMMLANKLVEKFPSKKTLKAKYYTHTGSCFVSLKELVKAKDYFEQAEVLFEPQSKGQAEHFSNCGNLFSNEGLLEEALMYYDKAIAIYKNFPEHKIRSAPVEVNRFDVLMEMKPYAEAAPLYTKFLSGFPDSTRDLKKYKRVGYNNLAWEHTQNNVLPAAKQNYQKALQLATDLTRGSHSVELARAHEGLGDVASKNKTFTKAIDHYHRAIQYLSVDFKTKDVLALPDLSKHIFINDNVLEEILVSKAKTLFDKYKYTQNLKDLTAAFDTYQRLDELLIQIRQGYKAAKSRYDLVEKTLPYYEKATQISLLLYEKTKDRKYLESAYNFASKNKAVVMLDGLQNERAQFAGIPSAIAKKETQLKKEINSLDVRIYEKKQQQKVDDPELRKLIDQRFEKTRTYEDLIQSFEEKYPKYFQIKYANTKQVDVQSIQTKLPPSTGVVEYFVGENDIYVFSFSDKSKLQYLTIDKPTNFEQDCLNYRQSIENDSITSIQEFSAQSFKLYQLLVQESTTKLLQAGDLNRLIIVPDDVLLQVSFEALFTTSIPKEQKMKWTNKLPFLLRDYAISYAYSNKLIFESTTNRRFEKATSSYIGFGLEYDDYTLEAIQKIQPTQSLPQLRRGIGKLIYSDDEVLESKNVMGGKTYINKKATKSNFLNEVDDANILHLATHGFIAKEDPMNSGLIFTKENETDDFILRTIDLYALDVKAGMTVLSACHSGGGVLQKGEGIRSLARAFNYAGCPNVTASLWAAPDLSTKKIVVPFYQFLKNGEPKDISLQKAKLDYLDKCRFDIEALPCNWAHLITIGNIDPISVVE